MFEEQFTSVIRGHHIYKSVLTPTLGQKLNCSEDDRKEAKQHDEYAIGTYLEANTGSEPVGHTPMESIPVFLLCTWALIRGWELKKYSLGVGWGGVGWGALI